MISCLLPTGTSTTIDSIERQFGGAIPQEPFSEPATAFVKRLSGSLLSDRSIRDFPELMALAHWFRPARVAELRKQLTPSSAAGCLTGRGVVFHIAPANVDSVFVYSWLLSLLCGNANIVRVSRRSTPQIEAFMGAAAGILAEPEAESVRRANLVITYDHDSELNQRLSQLCQLRVVWGGDATVALMRTVPIPALSAEVAFPNRFSLAVLSSEAVMALADAEAAQLAQRFHRDCFWFGQQACSSPRMIVWIGPDRVTQAAQRKFWMHLGKAIENDAAPDAAAETMSRVNTSFLLAQQNCGAKLRSPLGSLPTRIAVHTVGEDDRRCHQGYGVFFELSRASLDQLPALLSPLDQTIAYFGFRKEEWHALRHALPSHAADRVVPVGSALEFSHVWDGHDLLRTFTREITVL